MKGVLMDALSTPTRNFLNLHTDAPAMHWPYSPAGLCDAMRSKDLRFQMSYSVSELEKDLLAEGAPCVLQLRFPNDEEWELFANGTLIARGSQEFARACFAQDAWEFQRICRQALDAARNACGNGASAADEGFDSTAGMNAASEGAGSPAIGANADLATETSSSAEEISDRAIGNSATAGQISDQAASNRAAAGAFDNLAALQLTEREYQLLCAARGICKAS